MKAGGESIVKKTAPPFSTNANGFGPGNGKWSTMLLNTLTLRQMNLRSENHGQRWQKQHLKFKPFHGGNVVNLGMTVRKAHMHG